MVISLHVIEHYRSLQNCDLHLLFAFFFCFRAHLGLEKQLRKKVEELDKPPKYNTVVCREDPPEYMVSL